MYLDQLPLVCYTKILQVYSVTARGLDQDLSLYNDNKQKYKIENVEFQTLKLHNYSFYLTEPDAQQHLIASGLFTSAAAVDLLATSHAQMSHTRLNLLRDLLILQCAMLRLGQQVRL